MNTTVSGKGYSLISMARIEGLSGNSGVFYPPPPRGLKYQLVGRCSGGVAVFDEEGNGEMFFSHPPPYSCNQQPPVCEVKHAVMYEPPFHRRRGKPSREERERRRLQKAKDRCLQNLSLYRRRQWENWRTRSLRAPSPQSPPRQHPLLPLHLLGSP